jgi:hypothetical protein
MAIVYKHIRLDTNEVFYVGIGRTNKRPYNFVKRSLHHKNIIKKAGVEVEIVCENITWDEACEMEIKLIKEYGRIDLGNGLLINRTDGGEGSRNFVFSEEEKNRRSEYAKRQHREGKIDYNKISKTLSNKTLSNEHRKKISEGVKGKNSKLTENDVKLIKLKLKNEPHLSAKNIGDIFGVSKYVIKQIRSNNSWKYVQI